MMHLERPTLYVILVVGLGGVAAPAGAQTRPSEAAIAFAEEASELMKNTLVAALVQETDETTEDNVQQGSLSISLVFHDANLSMRLVGDLGPVSANDLPRDDFERAALADALMGEPRTSVELAGAEWFYRRSIPLSNSQPECALCHANFASMSSDAFVGALMLAVPIPGN